MAFEAQAIDEQILDISTNRETLVIRAGFPSTRPDELFAAWTVPGELTRWWPRQAQVEPGMGGRYHLSWPSMDWHLRGEYTAWKPGSRLAFTWRWDHDPAVVTTKGVDVRLIAMESGTRPILTHGTYPDTDAGSEERQGHLEGWRNFLRKLQVRYAV